METPLHHHYADGGIHPGCKRCQLEQAAPDLLAVCENIYKQDEQDDMLDDNNLRDVEIAIAKATK